MHDIETPFSVRYCWNLVQMLALMSFVVYNNVNFKFMCAIEATFSVRYCWNLVQMLALITFQVSLEHLGKN